MFRAIVQCLILALGLAACTHKMDLPMPLMSVDKPMVGTVAQAAKGATVLERGEYKVADALESDRDIVWSQGWLGRTVRMPAGLLVAGSRDDEYTYYYSTGSTRTDSEGMNEVPYLAAALRVRNGDLSDLAGVSQSGFAYPLESRPMLQRTEVLLVEQGEFQQRLIYRGRSGDTLSFEYRELLGDRQEGPVTYPAIHMDLTGGNVLRIGPVRIEVIEATDERLTYRVLASFGG